MKKNERLQAIEILIEVLQNKTPLSYCMQSSENLSPFSKELCFGICRQYIRLEALANQLLTKRPKQMDLWIVLLMGLYQLHYLRTPDYAVVKETVDLVETLKKPWAKGLVNAVLRTYCREQTALIATLEGDPAFQYGHPKWFVDELQKAWPKAWQAILKANDAHPPMSLRVNRQRTSTKHYLARLKEAGIDAEPLQDKIPGIVLAKPCGVYELPGFDTGDISVQDGAAQLAVSLLDLKPGLHLLDACAAPGGKTCHIQETEPNLASCIALDIDGKRLERVKNNLKRLHLNATLIKGNALHPETWWEGPLFDRILLDAPCSATGVIRRHPDIKLLRTKAEITAITSLQHQLLSSLWPFLKPGGLMVYATCSVLPQENEQQIKRFLTTQAECRVLMGQPAWGHASEYGWQILTGECQMDGFFYSVLSKVN